MAAGLAVAVVIALLLFYLLYLSPRRAEAARTHQRLAACAVADVIVATPTYPLLEQFLAVQWRYLRTLADGVGDTVLANALRSLPVTPDPTAMKPIAEHCHALGLGIVLSSG